MPDEPIEYIALPRQDQREILQAAAVDLGRQVLVLEKDIWICWTLQAIFSIPHHLPMAFKGGTSLSKVFEVIHRFSEDVDITIDYRSLDDTFDPFEQGASRTAIRKFGDRLKGKVLEYTRDVVQPYLSNRIAELPDSAGFTTELSKDGEKLRLNYPSALEGAGGYLEECVLLEFGGRNVIEPNEVHDVVPDIEKISIDMTFPRARVVVLSAERTFWEKATLIHAECGRGRLHVDPRRLSRHWYDVVMLARHQIARNAMEKRGILKEVVGIKERFFRAAYTNYDDCLVGRFRLVPDPEGQDALRKDYEEMEKAGMFHAESPPFDDLIYDLRQLEREINTKVSP